MTLDKAVLAFAGFVVLLGVVLSLTVHPYWIALTIFAGTQHDPGFVHGFLSRREDFQETRR